MPLVNYTIRSLTPFVALDPVPLQKDAGKSEQIVITMPLLIGLDGEKKMSKSMDNYIAFNDSPKDMFGKIMSVSDDLMWEYFRLLLNENDEEISKLKNEHPMKVKKDLAVQLTGLLNTPEDGKRELEQFEKVFSKNEIPDDMPEFSWSDLATENQNSLRLVDVMAATKLFASKKEIRRQIEQGAVKINSERCQNPNEEIMHNDEGLIIQSGKRTFFRVI